MKRLMPGITFVGMFLAVVSHSGARAASCESGTFEGAYANEQLVPQNWNCEERQEFWFTDQGSLIMPYTWFLHLEQADNTGKFKDSDNMNSYGYLPQKPTAKYNPDGLPIGFTQGRAKGGQKYRDLSRQWLGMTCAACHTGQVEFNGNSYLIEGAPTMGDFERLFQDLVVAMKATLADEAKFQRFAKAVIKTRRARRSEGTRRVSRLRKQLAELVSVREEWNNRNQGSAESGPYGHGRLDALGAIFNETSATALRIYENAQPADAPVSYPFVWDTPRHDKVQWNGSITNEKLGSLSRNVGEVLGVFGALELNKKRHVRTGHRSSVNVGALARLEALLWKLQSPVWSDTSLPPINMELADKGKEVFKQFCAGCHRNEGFERADPDRRIRAVMLPVLNPKDPTDPNGLRTDPTTAVNFLKRKGLAGNLSGRPVRYLKVLSDGKNIEVDESGHTAKIGVLAYSVAGTIVREFLTNPRDVVDALKAGQPKSRIAELEKYADEVTRKSKNLKVHKVRELLEKIGDDLDGHVNRTEAPKCFPDGILPCYKARPLNGIWATAPYLHNGSVRTMRQLLLPADKREQSFQTGSREYDPVNMGFVDAGASVLDTSMPGNSNAGHDGPIYGNQTLAEDKELMNALLEYLKTL